MSEGSPGRDRPINPGALASPWESGVVPARSADPEPEQEPESARQGARSARVEGTRYQTGSRPMSPGTTWMWPIRTAWRVANTPTGHATLRQRVQGHVSPARPSGGQAVTSWPPPACPWWWSTRARCATSPAPVASSPRPTRWMPRCSHTSPPPSSPACARAPINTCPTWSPAAASSGTCGPPSSSGAVRPPPHPGRHRCPAGRSGAWRASTDRAVRPAHAADPRRLAPHPRHSPPRPCSPCPAPSTASRSPPSSAWRPSRQRGLARAPPSGADGPRCMATLTACRLHPGLRACYQRSRRASRPRVALTACLRKLIVLCNALCKQQAPWNPAMAS